jgi:hypothetical protein
MQAFKVSMAQEEQQGCLSTFVSLEQSSARLSAPLYVAHGVFKQKMTGLIALRHAV